MLENPFVWGRPITNSRQIIGMDTFAKEVASILKGKTNVALFGPRDTGKTTFTTRLIDELSQDNRKKTSSLLSIYINLERAFSIPAFLVCVRDSMHAHTDKRVGREARRQLDRVEREIGFNVKLLHASTQAGTG